MKKLLILFLFIPFISNTQVNIDSLWGVWNDIEQPDTNRLKSITEIINNVYIFRQPDSAFYYAQLQLELAQEKGNKKFIGNAYNTQGISWAIRGENENAIDCYSKSLKARQEIGDKNGIASSYNNIGMTHGDQGNYDKAIEYYSNSLKVYEELGNKGGMGSAFNNIGTTYQSQGDLDHALEYYQKSLAIRIENNDLANTASAHNNIGAIYGELKEFDKALEYHRKGLEIHENNGQKRGMTSSFNHIGQVYERMGVLDSALAFYELGLQFAEEINYKAGIVSSLDKIGGIHYQQVNFAKAKPYAEKALAIAQEIQYVSVIKSAAQLLWLINKDLGKHKESLEMYELFITTKDSMESEANQKAVIQQQFKYAYEKQAAADSIKSLEEKKVQDALLLAEKAENKQRQQQQYYLYAGLALALIFGLVIFNRFKLAKKQKAIIEEQKKIVDEAFDGLEEAHKEITDSINYAERIQRSFLATTDLLDAHLNEYFVFFQPKDVVSGDFYWAGTLNNGHFAIVNADSTGHGVPGAIMSILNISAIESAVKDKLTKPADIFNDARSSIIARLKKDGSKEGGKDGMDASLISFNPEKTKMSYVAAQNPIWIIRKGELTEIKPEKMPVGKHDKDSIPFIGGEFEIQKDDQIYTLTDGYQDQFGGPKGKKFMIKRMRDYIATIADLPLATQHQKIAETFTTWKGDMEQVDDVCVIGIKI